MIQHIAAYTAKIATYMYIEHMIEGSYVEHLFSYVKHKLYVQHVSQN